MEIRAILSAFGGLLLSDVMTLDYNKTGPVLKILTLSATYEKELTFKYRGNKYGEVYIYELQEGR